MTTGPAAAPTSGAYPPASGTPGVSGPAPFATTGAPFSAAPGIPMTVPGNDPATSYVAGPLPYTPPPPAATPMYGFQAPNAQPPRPAAYDEHDEARIRRASAFGPKDGPKRPAGTPLLDLETEDTSYTWATTVSVPGAGVAAPSIAQRRVGATIVAPKQKGTPAYVIVLIVLAVVTALGVGVMTFLG